MIEEIKNRLTDNPQTNEIVEITGILLLAVVVYFVVKKVVLRTIKNLVRRTSTEYDDILLSEKILRKISYLAPLVLLHEFTYLVPYAADFLTRLFEAVSALLILTAVGDLLTGVTEILEKTRRFRDKPIKGYVQIIKIILYIYGLVLIIGIFTGESVWTLLGGLSALTAVLLLIFRDTILSFVASIQISSYDLVKVNDWIEVPKYGIDGDVVDISLHTIKVRNFDKTITTLPTHKIVEESFKNWRGMQQSGGRRIKRAIYIDISSIKFSTVEMLESYKKFQILSDYIDGKIKEIQEHNRVKNVDDSEEINGRRMTNIGTFRAYIKEYLRNRDDIRDDYTFLVRQLRPGEYGLPIEIYVFTNTTNWVEYEEIQADVFDHLLAAVPKFGLAVFQNPSGKDVSNLASSKQDS